jgi:hypothetical protein
MDLVVYLSFFFTLSELKPDEKNKKDTRRQRQD